MAFVAVSPFRPVQRMHPLAASPHAPLATGKAFTPPTSDVALAKSMQDAIARYPELGITTTLAEEWINEAKTFKGFEFLSASMLVATYVLMFLARSDTPTHSQVLRFAPEVMEPYQDVRLTPDEQEDLRIRQIADLWRYTKKIMALRAPLAED